MKPAIVVVAFNRSQSLHRLLSSLANASYSATDIPLIISIDKDNSSDQQDVLSTATNFEWFYGTKHIIQHSENVGLKNHILSCGDLSITYGAVMVLEDDIVVSPYFYEFAQQALDRYSTDPVIAGISLYAFEWSPVAERIFTPAQDGSDVYFFQNAQSWGQVWSASMWQDFKSWYQDNKDFTKAAGIPDNVKRWSDSSWLKYHIWYSVVKNKYFVYPYISLTTNFKEVGHHEKVNQNNYQVNLLAGAKGTYCLPLWQDSNSLYDVFFERQHLGHYLNIADSELCVDLYGKKGNREAKRYWLTIHPQPYKLVKSYGLQLRPHELNVIHKVEGREIFLYDTQVAATVEKRKERQLEARRTLYDMREVSSKNLVNVLYYRLLRKLNRL